MSLIVGHFTARGALDHAMVASRLQSFSPMPSLCAAEWPVRSYTTPSSGLLAKFKPAGPARVNAGTDAAGNTLLVFGIHNFAVPYLHRDPRERTLPTAELLQGLQEGEGEFVAALMEPSGTVHLVNDRFGAQPCFLTEQRGSVFFSTNLTFLQWLLGGPPTFDRLGLLQMFSYYHTLGPRTVVEGVRKLSPAVHVVIDGRGVAERPYWRMEHQVVDGMDPVVLAEEVWEAFREASHLRQEGRQGVIPLSGGLDSRMVAATVSPENFSTFTRNESLGEKPTREARVAIDVAGRLGLRHALRPFPSEAFSQMALDVAMLASALTPLNHPIKNMFSAAVADQTGGFYMSGAVGGTLAGAFVPDPDYVDSPWDEHRMRHFAGVMTRQTRGSLALVFRKSVMREWYPRLEPSLWETLEAVPGPTAAHRATIWGMTFRQPSFSFHSTAHNHPEVMDATPHLGYRYSDLMLRLPAGWIYKKSFYKFMLYHNLPRLRDVIYYNNGQPLPDHLHEHAAAILAGAARKKSWSLHRWAQGAIPPELLRPLRNLRGHSEKPRFYYQVLSADAALHASLREILHGHGALGELFDIPRCEQFLTNLAAGRCHSYTRQMDVCLLGGLLSACYFYHVLSS